MNYNARLENFRSLLPSIYCDGFLVEHPINLLYLTGLELSLGKLFFSKKEAALIVDGRYLEICRKASPCPVYTLEEMTLKKWVQEQKITHLGFESDKMVYQAFLNLKNALQDAGDSLLPITLIPVESAVQKLRWIKDEQEQQLLREAANLGYQGYEFVVSQLKEGISEAELALALEFFWKKKGAKKLAFDSIIAFGANGSMPHYRTGEAILTQGMPILIDIGVVWKHYHSDMTRVVFFGQPDPKIEAIYAIVEEAKQRALALCKPGTLIKELDEAARGYIAAKGYGDYFIHSLGHGLGLEIHESPTIRVNSPLSQLPLQPGMALTIEPGIYLPQIGGVRLEDTILITANGYENLTAR